MNIQKEIAARIKGARKAARLTQVEVAEKMGVDRVVVSKWERGMHALDIRRLYTIAEACGITVANLIPPEVLGLDKTPANGYSLDEYQEAAARTISRDLMPSEIETHALHGMVAEIGELHGLYQKVYQGHQADDVHLKKELGDLLWFIAEYCTACDWSLAEVAQMNIDKLKRRYPDGFDAEHSLHRKEGDI